MANQTALRPTYSFVKGLATEASPLAAPEGFCSAMQNVVLGQDGSLESRKGIEVYSSEFPLLGEQDGSSIAYAEIRGLDGGDPESRYLALFAGGTSVLIFDVTDVTNIVLLSEVSLFSSPPTHVSISATKGYFVVASDITRPIRVSLTSTSTLNIQERDFIGVDDGYQVNHRPSTLTTKHLYNLRNQGWPPSFITQFHYPSNADVAWLGMMTHPTNGLEYFSPHQLLNVGFGSTPAPKGAIILDAFDTTVPGVVVADINALSLAYDHASTTLTITLSGDYTTLYPVGSNVSLAGLAYSYTDTTPTTVTVTSGSGAQTVESVSFSTTTLITTMTFNFSIADYSADFVATNPGFIDDGMALLAHPEPEVETNHPIATCAWGSRVWYGGISPSVRSTLRGAVFYSQVVTTEDRLSKCYQDADPTARENNELVATDGGRVTITDMGVVYQMVPMGSSLLLFADNGVWSVSGRDGIFDPSNYAATMVSDRGVSSGMAAVMADGTVFYYSNGTVHTIQSTDLGSLAAKPISDHISSHLSALVDRDDTKVRLAYDRETKVVRIIFGKDVSVSQDIDELVLDMRLGAFYPLELTGYANDDGSYGGILGAWCPAKNYTTTVSTLYIALKNASDGTKTLQFLTMSDEDAVTDTWSGESFESYFSTHMTTLDSALIEKQMPRVGVYLQRKANSGLKVQGRYAWSNSGNSGKWGTKQEAYFDRGANFDVCWRTLSIRGSGKAVQLHFTNDALKPFKIYGWDIKYTGAPE